MQLSLPISFDPAVLSDRLLQTLDRSPHTQKFTNIRAQEMVRGIVSENLVSNLRKQIDQLAQSLDQNVEVHQILLEKYTILEQEYLSIKQSLKNHSKENHGTKTTATKLQGTIKKKQQELQQIKEECRSLRQQLEILNQGKSFLQETTSNQIKILENSLQSKNFIISQLQLTKNRLEQKNKQLQQEIKTVTLNSTNQNNEKIDRLQTKIQKQSQTIVQLKRQKIELKEEILKSTKRSNELQQREGVLKQKYQKVSSQCGSLKEKFKQEVSIKEQQKKDMSQKLNQLTKKYNLEQVILRRLKQQLKCVHKLKSQLAELKKCHQNQMQDSLKMIEKNFYQTMDEIAMSLNKQLESLIYKIGRVDGQLKIYKQQVKVKDQIIERLERMLDSQSHGTLELRNQLRTKKKQEDKLRKELVKHYQDTEVKLYTMEKKYQQILADSSNYYN